MFEVEVELWGGPMDGHKQMETTELRRYGPVIHEALIGPRRIIKVEWTEEIDWSRVIGYSAPAPRVWTGVYECEVISRESGPPWVYRWKGWDR